jgi:Spy/CpxP family protein refolding chaperone
VKLVRAFVAAAVALGAAVAIQMATTSDASAMIPKHHMCGYCWGVITE